MDGFQYCCLLTKHIFIIDNSYEFIDYLLFNKNFRFLVILNSLSQLCYNFHFLNFIIIPFNFRLIPLYCHLLKDILKSKFYFDLCFIIFKASKIKYFNHFSFRIKLYSNFLFFIDYYSNLYLYLH